MNYLMKFFILFKFSFNAVWSIDGPKKILWFLFDKVQDPDSVFYCPQKHETTKVEDLCYLFYTFKKTHKSAEEICKKFSHRLAVIDSKKTWLALQEVLEKSLNLAEFKSLRFHIGPVYQNEADFYWNSSNTLIDRQIFCRKTSKSPLIQQNLSNSCIELIHKESNYKSLGDSETCLKIVDCHSVRYSICEWRGDSIQSYNLELTSQLINSYISLVVIIALFSFLWIVLYKIHKFRVKNIILKACADYKEELKIFNLNTRD